MGTGKKIEAWPLIGGGASLVALREGQTVITTCGRWHLDIATHIAQTRAQLTLHEGCSDPHSVRVAKALETFTTGHPATCAQRVGVSEIRDWLTNQTPRNSVIGNATRFYLEGDELCLEVENGGDVRTYHCTQSPVLATGMPAMRYKQALGWTNVESNQRMTGDEASTNKLNALVKKGTRVAIVGGRGTAISAAEK